MYFHLRFPGCIQDQVFSLKKQQNSIMKSKYSLIGFAVQALNAVSTRDPIESKCNPYFPLWWTPGGQKAGWTPACSLWQCTCSWGTVGSPACSHTRRDCGAAGLPWRFSSQNFFSCFVASAGTGTTEGFIRLQHWAALTVRVLLTRSSASQSQQQTVLVVLPVRSVWPDRQYVDLHPFISQKRFLEDDLDPSIAHMTMGYIFSSYNVS